MFLENLIIISALDYYRVFYNPTTLVFKQKLTYVILECGIYIPNYIHFYTKHRYKNIIIKYDAWPKDKNLKGSILVCGFIILIIANTIVASNLGK
jgi:hypothetical protein